MEHRKRGERIQRGESMEVTVAGQTMHAVRWGAGTPVIFLSGSSVLFPWMEYGTFLEECSAFCQVTLLERLGYGNSTIPKGPRTIGGAVAEYRQAWKVLGGPQPVVVMAHSMGFLEALHWAQSAPKEVRALIGIDGATTESYRMFPIERAARTLDLLAKQPLAALLSQAILRRQWKGLPLCKEEKRMLKRRAKLLFANPAWRQEAQNLQQGLQAIQQGSEVEQPTLLFVSNGKGTGQTRDQWRKSAADYCKEHPAARLIPLDRPHDLYRQGSREIVDAIRSSGLLDEQT